jgi:glycosyltransferase involved in cell wall biosynthesis
MTLRVRKRHISEVEDEVRRAQLGVELDHYPGWARYHATAVATIAARRSEYDVVLTQNFCPPFAGSRRAVLVHDVLFVTNPEWFTKTELLYLSAIRPSLRRATTVLATSHSEATRIGTVWPELRGRIAKVGLSIPEGIVEARSKCPSSWNESVPFVLTVSRLNVRKNLTRLIEAFALAARHDPNRHLVIVGEEDGACVPITIPDKVISRIHFLGYVTENELRWLYENCELFVFPSLGEGYGLPLIEANLLGARIVASDIPVFRELAVATGYFDPRSVDEIAGAILIGLNNPAIVSPGRLTWEDVARNIRDAVNRAPDER